jgi:hypothetical protein
MSQMPRHADQRHVPARCQMLCHRIHDRDSCQTDNGKRRAFEDVAHNAGTRLISPRIVRHAMPAGSARTVEHRTWRSVRRDNAHARKLLDHQCNRVYICLVPTQVHAHLEIFAHQIAREQRHSLFDT